MKGYRRTLPSLDALVFFEAAGRHNSFTASAAELSVTQAAVSKRIKELEAQLGLRLFHRNGRTLTMTEAGRRIHERTSMALEYLEDAVRAETDHGGEMVRIAANSAVSIFWLGPRLRRFGLGTSAGAVRVSTSDRLRDLLDPENDLAITYGHGDSPGWDSVPLFAEELVPVARPDYLRTLGVEPPERLDASDDRDVETWERVTLLEYDRIAPDWVNWKVWIEALGAGPWTSCPTLRCDSYAQAIGEAIDGKGLALGSLGLIDDELDAGRLCRVGRRTLRTGRGYFLSVPRQRKLPGAAAALRRSLLSE